MRVRTGLALAFAVVALAGCSDEETDAGDGPGASPSRGALATAGPETAHLLLHGTVTHGDEPVPGAEVWLSLFPEDTSDVEVGEVVDTLETEPVETDDDGGFVIEVDPDTLSSTYFNATFLNYDVMLRADDELATWSSTAWLVREDHWRSDERARVGDAVTRMDFDLAAPTLTLTDSYGEPETDELPLAERAREE